MDRNKLEGEEIQKGLEEFLEQELYQQGTVRQRSKELDLSLAQSDELDLSLANANVSTEPDLSRTKRPTEPDLSLAYGRKKKEPDLSLAGTASDRKNHSKESGQREMPQRKKQEPAGKRKQENTRNKRQEPVKSKKTGSAKGKNKKQDKRKKNRGVKVLMVIAALLVIGIFGLYLLVGSVYKKMNYQEVEAFNSEPMKEDGVINVLLIGNDSRLAGDDGRSDAMILVSISDKTKTITMTSLLRDMYVEIPGHDGNRLNAAYSYGGPELLMETIELNFDIPVHRYALVNFQAFANLVDAVGGIDLELTNDEVKWVNAYLMEYNQLEGKDLATDFLDPSLSGMIHLNGPQALAFTRNRYIGTDFGRTERQRKVLTAVIGKLPGTVLTNGGELSEGLFPNLTTNLKQGECFNLSLNAWKILGYDIEQQCIPVEGTYSNADIRGMAVLQVDFEANKQFLKTTLYGE
ncbi:MAG: LCP family protein [Lachnospiraceae bacterium]|nr:LCP family protein [Lachnospiraceae bacterium]